MRDGLFVAKKVTLTEALDHVDPLADWYIKFLPSVKAISLTRADYAAFEQHPGRFGISIDEQGLHYRGFLLKQAGD